ncbi:MAG: energy transducer TonB [Acidobacteriota bacterium]|nr:energy transducer TonB [Acidobacteriota bacterium]
MPFDFVFGQSPIRLAMIDFVGDGGSELSAALRQSVTPEFELLDANLVRAATRGAGYSGSLNLSRDEARSLGQSLGCDFFVLGKTLSTRRLVGASGEQAYFETLAGLFFVEARTGKLILFSFESAKSETEIKSKEKLRVAIKQAWPRYADAMLAARKHHAAVIENFQPLPPAVEVLTDDLTATGVQQPFFYQRLKPDYTEQADLAGITATVELEAVFREDGTVGEIEVVRWAGFGLDESAIATVKKLRFKPAERDGKKLTLQGLVRYNFRRPLSQAERQEEIEKLKRSLRDIKKPPSQIPGQRPKP